MALHIQTPLIESFALSNHCDCSIWLKLESLQPSGSFKMRGVGRACEVAKEQGAKRLISSSGGNAGIAVAYAGRCLSIPANVVVPESTSERAKSLIQQQGAELVVEGSSWMEANALAESMASDTARLIHPFDDPILWEGHSTMIDEVIDAGFKPDAVVLSVGGGGLLSGVVQGLVRHGLKDVPIITAETEGAASFHSSIQVGERVELAQINSLATSLGAKRICQQAFDLTNEHPVQSVLVSDAEAVLACLRFLDDHRLLVEPACGAALALAYQRSFELRNYQKILIIACGGVTTSLAQLQQWSNDA